MITKAEAEKNINKLNTESLTIYAMILELLDDDKEEYTQLKQYVLKKARNGENI